LDRLHPRLAAWYRGLATDPRWSREVDPGPTVSRRIAKTRAEHARAGATLSAVAGF